MTKSPAPINAMLYADLAQTSSIPVTGKLNGDEVWFVAAAQIQTNDNPQWFAIHENQLLIGYNHEILALSSQDGKILWRESIRKQFTFMCDEQGVLINRFTKWRAFADGRHIKRHISKPENCYITALEYGDEFYWYGYYTTKVPKVRGQKYTHRFQFNRHLAQRGTLTWHYQLQGQALGSLCSLDKKTFYIIMPEEIHFFPVTAQKATDVKNITVPPVISFALDYDGGLVLVVKDPKKDHMLIEVAPTGDILWQIPLRDKALSNQPPASSPQKTIYYGDEGNLLAIEQGKEIWRVNLTNGSAPIYITVLADNSTLVSSLHFLFLISPQGKVLKSLTSPMVMTCRPIMDQNGIVFTGGKEGIRCWE